MTRTGSPSSCARRSASTRVGDGLDAVEVGAARAARSSAGSARALRRSGGDEDARQRRERGEDPVDVLVREHRGDDRRRPRERRRDVAHGLGRVGAVPDLVAAALEPSRELHRTGGHDRPAEEGRGRGAAERAVAARLDDDVRGAVPPGERLPLRLAEHDGRARAGRRPASPRRSPRASRRAPRCARARRSSAPATGERRTFVASKRPPSPASTAATRRRPRRTRPGPRRSAPRTASPRGARPAPDARERPLDVGLLPSTRIRSAQPRHVRRRVGAGRERPRGAASPRSSASSSTCRSCRRRGSTESASCGSPSAASSARIRSSPNPSCGPGAQRLEPVDPGHSATERIELAPVPLELLALGLDDLGGRVRRRSARWRASSRRARSPC